MRMLSSNYREKLHSFYFQMLMNVSGNLVATVELARIYQEATDANVNQDFLASTARLVRVFFSSKQHLLFFLIVFLCALLYFKKCGMQL